MTKRKDTYKHVHELIEKMGSDKYCLWLDTLDPPLDTCTDEAVIRRVVVSKLIEVDAEGGTK